MKLLVLLVAVVASQAEWKPKMLPSQLMQPKEFEVAALECGGWDTLADGQELTIETPNFPANYPNKTKCKWNIEVPALEEVHIWCETFDIKRGDKFSIKGIIDKVYGTFPDGMGHVIPAADEERTFDIKRGDKFSIKGIIDKVY